MDTFLNHILPTTIGGIIIVIFTFFISRYIFRPKHCSDQEERCRKYIDSEVTKVMQSVTRGKFEMEEEKRRSELIYARSDVITPQFKGLRNDMRYIRRRVDQLAADRKLVPVDGDPEED
jgi:hypothetical protein